MLVVRFRELQFWQDTDSLSKLLAAPFRVKTIGCIGLTVVDGVAAVLDSGTNVAREK